jgi:hypothetical protein
MKARCLNPRISGYPEYGGRGITICKRWMKFENFLADMGERPKGTTLDRKDNDGPYAKWNCCWSTPKQQSGNRKILGRKNSRRSRDPITGRYRRAGDIEMWIDRQERKPSPKRRQGVMRDVRP